MGSGQCADCAKNKTGLQWKLVIGASHDPLEQEADRIADQVMAAPAHSDVSGTPPHIQRFAGHVTGENGTAPARVDRVLASSGRPLDLALQQDMEQRFGYDFSRVRVHSGAAAEQSAHEVNAHAYTVGSHIVFGTQQYRPGNLAGNWLLAHELAHTIQQGAVRRADAGALHIRTPNEGSVASGEPFVGLALRSVEPVLQRACGSAEIGSVGGCIARGGDITDFGISSDSIYLFNKNCDDFAPGERARLGAYARTIASDARVDIDGFASEEGEPGFNENLSCARALQVQEVILAATGVQATIYKHGATSGDRPTHRSVVITLHTPEPEAEPEQTTCTPKPGIKNSECDAYVKESWWLPEAYVHNATCACQETPNVPTANCMRKFLQDRLGQVDREVKVEASHWLGALMTRRVSKSEYVNFVQLNLTPIIFKDHVDAYRDCCCPSGPAPLEAWRGVTTFALPCAGVGAAIRQFGSCHGTPGEW